MNESKVLTIENTHCLDCGIPPNLFAGEHYTGYFENVYGDQFVFKYNDETEKGMLWSGDLGWSEQVEVIDGVVPGVILGPEEQIWLSLVWMIATGG